MWEVFDTVTGEVVARYGHEYTARNECFYAIGLDYEYVPVQAPTQTQDGK